MLPRHFVEAFVGRPWGRPVPGTCVGMRLKSCATRSSPSKGQNHSRRQKAMRLLGRIVRSTRIRAVLRVNDDGDAELAVLKDHIQ